MEQNVTQLSDMELARRYRALSAGGPSRSAQREARILRAEILKRFLRENEV